MNTTAGLLPCPFPHEVKRGVFLESDAIDFGFIRGACADCGCAGPYVTLASCDKVADHEREEAIVLWNTRTPEASDTLEMVVDPARVQLAISRVRTVLNEADFDSGHVITSDNLRLSDVGILLRIVTGAA